jgi:isoleucyl-tRNA synthetase
MDAYERYQYHTVFHTLHNFCVVDLSNFYLDILKDRMYASGRKSALRRSAQTVFLQLVEGIVKLMAPVLAFTSEEVWELLPGQRPQSVFLSRFPEPDDTILDTDLDQRYQELIRIREVVTKALEEKRQDKIIGNSLEADIRIECTQEQIADFLHSFGTDLADLFIVSNISVQVVDSITEGTIQDEKVPGLGVEVTRTGGTKCERCWKFTIDVGSFEDHPAICGRCHAVLEDR